MPEPKAMTPEEVITNAILEADARNGFPSPRNFRAQHVLTALSNAGFVVVPRETFEEIAKELEVAKDAYLKIAESKLGFDAQEDRIRGYAHQNAANLVREKAQAMLNASQETGTAYEEKK